MRILNLFLGGLAATAALFSAHDAPAEPAPESIPAHSVVYGLIDDGRTVSIPSRTCVRPGQQLRLQADLVDDRGRRFFRPAEDFVWRLTRTNGRWDRWDAGSSWRYGPFERGIERDSVYVTVPRDIGGYGRLEVVSRGHRSYVFQVVDEREAERDPRQSCFWAHNEVYLDRQPPEDGARRCYDRCSVGARCTDGCPRGARCRYIRANPPYWRVVRCRSNPRPRPRPRPRPNPGA